MIKERKGVFISSWIHPGETGASWILLGLIKFLLSDNKDAEALRNNFVFKIVPMLNIDGVIHGNYWTSLSGADLNWWWKHNNPDLYPTIYHSKQFCKKFYLEWDIVLHVDLHGHSWKRDCFMYGNTPEASLFPFILSKLYSSFNFNYC